MDNVLYVCLCAAKVFPSTCNVWQQTHWRIDYQPKNRFDLHKLTTRAHNISLILSKAHFENVSLSIYTSPFQAFAVAEWFTIRWGSIPWILTLWATQTKGALAKADCPEYRCGNYYDHAKFQAALKVIKEIKSVSIFLTLQLCQMFNGLWYPPGFTEFEW